MLRRDRSTVSIRDPDRNVLELVGPGPSVVDLIRDHVALDRTSGRVFGQAVEGARERCDLRADM
jgi:hypothetical protein